MNFNKWIIPIPITMTITLIMVILATITLAPHTMAAKPETDCKHMKLVDAMQTFRYIDTGEASRFGEWRISSPQTLVHAGGPVTGRMPQGFYGLDEQNLAYYEGAQTTSATGALTIVCLPSPGTAHVALMPQRCPVFAQEAVDQVGGFFENWQESDSTYATILSYLTVPGVQLGNFTVPFQGIVAVEEPSGQTRAYYPGDRVPASEGLMIECSKAETEFIPPLLPEPVAP